MRKFHFLGFIFLILISLSPIFAEEFYADINLEVDTSGWVEISGMTNHTKLLAGKTQDYISNKGDEWILNITIEDNFSEYVYDISFPINTVIIPIKISSDFRMETRDRRLHFIGAGEDEPLQIVMQYYFDEKHEPLSRGRNSSANSSRGMLNELLIVQVILILLLIAVLSLTGFYFIRHRKKQEKIEEPKYNPEALTDRQKLIVSYLEKKKKPVTQAELQREIGLPKASLSRNIDSLVKKEIIKKERKGMTNVIFINKN